jgi:hypothetical protein
MYRLLPGYGDVLTSCQLLNTSVITHDKLSYQWSDFGNGVLQTRLHRFTAI